MLLLGVIHDIFFEETERKFHASFLVVSHWKSGHKGECNEMRRSAETGVSLEKPKGEMLNPIAFNPRTGQRTNVENEGAGYRKPNQVAVNEKFYVKVQGGGPEMPLMIYDETRQCCFSYSQNLQNFHKV